MRAAGRPVVYDSQCGGDVLDVGIGRQVRDFHRYRRFLARLEVYPFERGEDSDHKHVRPCDVSIAREAPLGLYVCEYGFWRSDLHGELAPGLKHFSKRRSPIKESTFLTIVTAPHDFEDFSN